MLMVKKIQPWVVVKEKRYTSCVVVKKPSYPQPVPIQKVP